MAVTEQTVQLSPETVARIQAELRLHDVDGWLLFNFHGFNAVANDLLSLPALTRRYFVWIPTEGKPVAITHRIEQQPWTGWIGDNWPYSSWRELDTRLGQLLSGNPRVAMEYAPGDAVPYVDKVPAGVIEMIRATGAEPVTSGDLVSAFYARWSEEGLASHRRAARHVYEVAHEAFGRIQRFSTDWHANSFAGSTVRKITRVMWGIDSLNDQLLMMLMPSAVMLIGTVRTFRIETQKLAEQRIRDIAS